MCTDKERQSNMSQKIYNKKSVLYTVKQNGKSPLQLVQAWGTQSDQALDWELAEVCEEFKSSQF